MEALEGRLVIVRKSELVADCNEIVGADPWVSEVVGGGGEDGHGALQLAQPERRLNALPEHDVRGVRDVGRVRRVVVRVGAKVTVLELLEQLNDGRLIR